jgi:hypothetical protein
VFVSLRFSLALPASGGGRRGKSKLYVIKPSGVCSSVDDAANCGSYVVAPGGAKASAAAAQRENRRPLTCIKPGWQKALVKAAGRV